MTFAKPKEDGHNTLPPACPQAYKTPFCAHPDGDDKQACSPPYSKRRDFAPINGDAHLHSARAILRAIRHAHPTTITRLSAFRPPLPRQKRRDSAPKH